MAHKTTEERIQQFILFFKELSLTTSLFPGEALSIEVLINPCSGYFKNIRTFKRIRKALLEWESEPHKSRSYRDSVSISFHKTESKETLKDEVLSTAINLSRSMAVDRKILILAGGDGFHRDVIDILMKNRPELLEDIIFFRLPLGTGNDSSDAESLLDVCRIFSSEGCVTNDNLIRIDIPKNGTHYGFNVASLGIDAYICQLTNQLKAVIKGDIFKVLVDLTTLFYDWKFKSFPMTIEIKNKGTSQTLNRRFILYVFGKSGHITYGGKKRILPTNANFFLLDFVGILKRLIYKNPIMKGQHTRIEEAHFFAAETVEFQYDNKILLEIDGEVFLLEKDNFPLKFSRLENRISILSMESLKA